MCPCRGRRRGRRWISEIPPIKYFCPGCDLDTGAVSLTLEEIEALRLADLLDLDQEKAAHYMGISRKAFWNDLMSARGKVATALVYGMGIGIDGGSYVLREARKDSDSKEQAISRDEVIALIDRELKVVRDREEILTSRMNALKAENRASGDKSTTTP